MQMVSLIKTRKYEEFLELLTRKYEPLLGCSTRKYEALLGSRTRKYEPNENKCHTINWI